MDRRQFVLSWFPFFWRRQTVRLEGARFRIARQGRSSRRYLHIHGNEQTAREVLRAHMNAYPGIAHMIMGNRRNVKLEGGFLDPNRMFSREGAEKNLRLLNPGWTAEQLQRGLDRLDRGREFLVRALLPPADGLIVALHNNSEGYSARDEVATSDRVSLNSPAEPHEFFLCTQAADYEKLAFSPYNVVLQNSAPNEDDGSLSRLAARRGARYINLECALGKALEQKRMMEWLERNLP